MRQKSLRNLSPFLDFEAAARWNSFKLAAKELNKTAAAVSQQIKSLEQQLGFALFERHPRHICLTAKGRELAATTQRALADLNQKVAALREGPEENVLRLTAPHSLAMKWLIPEFPEFTRRYPGIDLRFDISDDLVDMSSGAADIALRICEQSQWGDSLLLAEEMLIAVYSPKLRTPPLHSDELDSVPLLYQESPEQWIQWLSQNRAIDGQHHFAQNFSHSGVLVQSAVAGHGVALVPYIIARDDLEMGLLQEVEGKPLFTHCGIYLLSNQALAEDEKVQAFTGWIQPLFEELQREMDARKSPLQRIHAPAAYRTS